MNPVMPPTDLTTLGTLLTEARNSATTGLDTLPTLDLLRIINDEDATVAAAVRAELPGIAAAVDAIATRFARGGRLFYLGAGTSGRLGVLDASEIPPTFSASPDLFVGLIAGGDRALRLSSEHSEDSPEEGAHDLQAAGFGFIPNSTLTNTVGVSDPASGTRASTAVNPPFSTPDTLLGIAASGRTPYVLGALAHAQSLNALTVGLSCVPDSPLARAADFAITPATGPEVLTGSTRLKAGTATKLVLNMLSTAIMVRTGATFGNLMVNVRPTNAKLIDRAERIIAEATGCDRPTAAHLLQSSGLNVKTAILMGKVGLPRDEAEARLQQTNGDLRTALDAPNAKPTNH